MSMDVATDVSTRTIDNTLPLLADPQDSFANKRHNLQIIYESLVESRKGRRRYSIYTSIGEKARQGDANAVGFLEFVAGQLDRWDRNAALESRETQRIAKFGARGSTEQDYTHGSSQYDTQNQNSPLAKRIRSQNMKELDRLPALQIDALWNEILFYARMGFDGLSQRNVKYTALDNCQLPEITETPTTNFLLLSLVGAVSKQPIHLRDFDREYLETGRGLSENGSLGAGYAASLIEKAASVMEQIAQSHGIDISGKIERKTQLVEKLNGADLINRFESYGRSNVYRLAEEGKALRVFDEVESVVGDAGKYRVPLELIITGQEMTSLKTQAVNHPDRGLRGELLEIAEEVASGKTYRRFDLRRTDELVPFCNNPTLVLAYQKIKSAIEALADSAYQEKLASLSGRALQTSHKPVDDLVPASAQLAESIPFNPRFMYNLKPKRTSMTSDDARAILSMFESGNLEGILNYGAQYIAASYTTPPMIGGERRKSVAGMLAAMGGLAAVIAGLLILPNQTRLSQRSDYNRGIVEIDCTGVPRLYGEGTGQGNVEEMPTFVCKPGTEPIVPRGDMLLPNMADASPSSSADTKVYKVVLGDNLTHIMKRQAGITDERQAYLEALRQAKLNNIPNPNHIEPGQKLIIYSK